MDLRDGLVPAIGNTPLIRLRRLSELTGCDILGKAEFLEPGGSVKDRAALAIVLDAERRGLLRPGGVIVEGTAGNTGIGLTLVGNARGYRTVIVIPETQSQEKKDTLRLGGAALYEVPAVPYKNPNNYVKLSGRLADELAKTEPNGAVWANQFDNAINRQAHIETTGPEIWRQTVGQRVVLHLGAGDRLLQPLVAVPAELLGLGEEQARLGRVVRVVAVVAGDHRRVVLEVRVHDLARVLVALQALLVDAGVAQAARVPVVVADVADAAPAGLEGRVGVLRLGRRHRRDLPGLAQRGLDRAVPGVDGLRRTGRAERRERRQPDRRRP